jgi:hypothetical protein
VRRGSPGFITGGPWAAPWFPARGSVTDANMGSILGIGPRGFVLRAREVAERYGKPFLPPASLVRKADKGELLK